MTPADHVISTTGHALSMGNRIRERRKALGVSATSAAESAGMSRVTWHRIERGTTTVTLGAWLAALAVLDMVPGVALRESVGQRAQRETTADSVPVTIVLADYPQLQRLAWQLQGTETVSPHEALALYERNWRHLDEEQLQEEERQLIAALRTVFSEDSSRV